MISFKCDYAEGAHPKILNRLVETNFEQLDGYGEDRYTVSAKERIARAFGLGPGAQVHFLTGGTQANSTIIDSLLAPYEGAVAAVTGHIGVHEAGAVEFTGHKVLTLPQHLGKIDAGELRAFLQAFHADPNKDHMVWPGLVYASFPTEYGTLYSKAELAEIHAIAQEYHIPFFLDGARLGYALASEECDVSPEELKDLCDVFYVGGTKVGALCGEAAVFPHGAPAHFFTIIKQHGALMAKGRLLGIQFDTLFTDGLYLEISRHAIRMARELRRILHEKGIPFYLESPTNQQFVILENSRMAALSSEVGFDIWEPLDAEHTVVRFATSWATPPENLEQLKALL